MVIRMLADSKTRLLMPKKSSKDGFGLGDVRWQWKSLIQSPTLSVSLLGLGIDAKWLNSSNL
jgi:hypothetical protein